MRIRKRIVFITKYGMTTRGHARNYWIILECGHVHVTSYSIHVHLNEFELLQGMKPLMRCRDCEGNKPPDLELLKRFTPYRIWDAENFDRFEKKEGI